MVVVQMIVFIAISIAFWYGVYRLFKYIFTKKKLTQVMVCSNCGTIGTGKQITPGSLGIEIVLWCCLAVPGIIYSIWRLTNKKIVCTTCGGENLIPSDSPVGKKIIDAQLKPTN